ncbi:MAG: ATP-binding cassette domain-containing protein [Deltaproteobacteria bacterium]|nr:ATP-binding cassette domain-containing protein [Deltaproteobacteria bacterium]
MIKVESLSRRYGDLLAVDNVSFEIGAGEIIGLLGHNGAGKTTILKMLTGFLEPSGGRITIDGLDMEKNRSAIQQRIGYLPENCPLYPEMTVIGFLEYAASLHDIPEHERPARLHKVVERTELIPKAAERINTLSKGYRQRVGVAQAIMHEPKIIILDEPTSGLDPSQIFHMRNLIKDLARKATVILSTHILQEVQATCDRVIILRNGEIYLDFRLESLSRANRLIVETDARPDATETIFHVIDGVVAIETISDESGSFRYALSIDGEQAADTAPVIAKAVIEHGASLYSLYPESRSLEAIFGDMSVKDGRLA